MDPKSFDQLIKSLDINLSNASNQKTKENLLLQAISQSNAKDDKTYHIYTESSSIPTDYEALNARGDKQTKVFGEIAKKHNLMPVLESLLVQELSSKPLGSGPDYLPMAKYFCANTGKGGTFCTNEGKKSCSNCLLVAYCSKDCQIAHWPYHKEDCKTCAYVDGSWRPAWETEGREPSFVSSQEYIAFGHRHSLWGNTPVFDLLNLNMASDKEYLCSGNGIKLMFAACGDLRFVIETLASIPEEFSEPLKIVLNDKNPIIVARNLVMLLCLAEGKDAIDTVINLWYSCALTQHQHLFAANLFVSKIVSKIKLMSKSVAKLKNGKLNLRLHNLKQCIAMASEMMCANWDCQTSNDARTDVVLHPSRIDYRHRHLIMLKKYHKVAWKRFRDYGILLPMGSFVAHHNMPNKLLFSSAMGWLMTDAADPLTGWQISDVAQYAKAQKLPKNDVYGHLFFYIRSRLELAVQTLERLEVQIDLFCEDAHDLAKQLIRKKELQFDRIDVSNISDENYLGINTVLNDWGSLLNSTNKDATLITLFMNWGQGESNAESEMQVIMDRTRQRMTSEDRLKFLLSPYSFIAELRNNVTAKINTYTEFKPHLKKLLSKRELKLKQRKQHEIVPPRFFVPIGSQMSETLEHLDEEDMYNLNFLGVTLTERYVEWTN